MDGTRAGPERSISGAPARLGGRAVAGLWLGYAVVLAALCAVVWVPLTSARVAPLACVLTLAGLGWWLSVRSAASVPARARAASTPAIVAGALVLRLVALASAPELSDDIQRYVWEGALVLEGRSPYAHAPDSPELAEERARWSELHARVNHREVSAAYPPLAQLFHAALVALAGGVGQDGAAARALMRVAYALCDLLLLVPLSRLLALAGRPAALACVWGFSPLVALEFAGTGHVDVLAILLLVAALASARASVSGALLAAGTSVKLLPLCALPFRAQDPRGRARLLASFALVLVLCCAPFLWGSGALDLGRGLGDYALRWESFHLLYRWIERPLAAWLGPGSGDESWSDPRRAGRLVAAALWLGASLWAWRGTRARLRQGHEPRLVAARGTFTVVGAFLVLTPTLHPWYLAWIVPFLALFPSRAWSWLVAAVPLAYWPLERWRAEGAWLEPAWLWPALALPFWALLVLDWRRDAARR